MRIALTGGIASGKSLVAKYLNELGVETIDADDIVHELLPDPAERRRIAAEVFADPAKRRALEAKLHPIVKERINAFLGQSPRPVSNVESPRLVSNVESLTSLGGRTFDVRHSTLAENSGPWTLAEDVGHSTFAEDSRRSTGTPRVAVIPLLFETRWNEDYDIICCVRSSRATQVARMMATRGYSRDEAEARLAAQMPVEEKAAKSHYVIDNDGSEDELNAKVAQFVAWLSGQV